MSHSHWVRDKMMKKFFENSFCCSFYKFLRFLFLKNLHDRSFYFIKMFHKMGRFHKDATKMPHQWVLWLLQTVMLWKCNQHTVCSARRQILLLKMIHPEGLCLAKVRVAPKTTGSKRMAKDRASCLTLPAVSRVYTYGVTSGSKTPAVLWNKLKDKVSTFILDLLAMVG